MNEQFKCLLVVATSLTTITLVLTLVLSLAKTTRLKSVLLVEQERLLKTLLTFRKQMKK